MSFRFCPQCATPLEWLPAMEDGGMKERLRCVGCGWTHWNNPTPVLAAVIECADREGQLLLARNAAWKGRMFALITGFMEGVYKLCGKVYCLVAVISQKLRSSLLSN